MSEKRFVEDHSYLVNYGKYCILDKLQHKHLYLDEVCRKLNNQDEKIRQLTKEKGELMECNACQYREIQKWESENEELMKKVFLYKKGIAIYLQKEEQMNLYTYVDLEMKRWRFDNE